MPRHTHLTFTILLVRFSIKDLEKEFEKTEDDIKAVQSVGQIIGEVLKQLDDERCASFQNLIVINEQTDMKYHPCLS